MRYFSTRRLPAACTTCRFLCGHGMALHFIDGVAHLLRLEAPFTTAIKVRRTTR